MLRVMVDGDGGTQEEAYGAAARIADAGDAVFGAQSASMGRITTAALVVQPRTRWHKGEDVRTGWRARRTSLVELRALCQVFRTATAGGAVGPACCGAAAMPTAMNSTGSTCSAGDMRGKFSPIRRGLAV